MKYVDEYRDLKLVETLAEKINRIVTRPWNIMEICGGQTHAIMKYGLGDFLPSSLNLIHGPGCPVCVTPLEKIDIALELAAHSEVIFTSFGDMLRVPGSSHDLLRLKAQGADIRVVYSPLDAVKIARENPEREVVFFAIGFETTAPVNALAVSQAKKLALENFSIISSHVLVPPAMELILSSPGNLVNGFLAAGHVCAVMGFNEYIPLAEKYGVPIAVTGFEPLDVLKGILSVVEQLEQGTCHVTNEYKRAVKTDGNIQAQQQISEVFEKCDQTWRGIGMIPNSGLRLNANYEKYDAEKKFSLPVKKYSDPEICLSGQILQGRLKPHQCPAFSSQCTPEHPLGAPMVSHEGACNAYYRFQKN
ncbi:MAG: hydrogenase formation protein HypD [Bacteroidales bacterium]|nr:hydrogenase formation protein HypD [Bacteroidales bacterium]